MQWQSHQLQLLDEWHYNCFLALVCLCILQQRADVLGFGITLTDVVAAHAEAVWEIYIWAVLLAVDEEEVGGKTFWLWIRQRILQVHLHRLMQWEHFCTCALSMVFTWLMDILVQCGPWSVRLSDKMAVIVGKYYMPPGQRSIELIQVYTVVLILLKLQLIRKIIHTYKHLSQKIPHGMYMYCTVDSCSSSEWHGI